MRARPCCIALFTCLLATASAPAGQSRPVAPPPSASPDAAPPAAAVRLDVFATLDGRPVDDLTRNEIEVREDGVPQTIETFEHVQISAAAGAAAPSPSADGTASVPARARVFVVFIDTYHAPIETSTNLRLPLVRFLDRTLADGDLVALLTPEMSAAEIAFVAKAAVISNIMQADWAWARRGGLTRQDPKEALYDSCYAQSSDARNPSPAQEMKARRREKLTFEALDGLVARLGGLRDERKAVLTVTDGWELFHAVTQPAATAAPRRPSPGDIFRRRRDEPAERERAQGISRIECETDRAELNALDHSSRLIELGEQASRGLIAFYPISPSALLAAEAPTTADRGRTRASDLQLSAARLDSMRFLADATDGVALTDGRQAERALERIAGDQSSYYLLSYASTNAKLDGRLRAITVRSTRPDVKIRTRRGYRGRSAEDLLRESTSSSPVSTNVNAKAPFRIRASSWASSSAGEEADGAFWIVGELDYRVRRELAWTAGAQADITVLGADGTELVSRTVDVPASDGGFGVRVPEDSGLRPGDYAVRVRVRPTGADDLALTDSARVVVPSGHPTLGESVMWRRGPSTGPRFLMTADARFQRSDRIRLELPTEVTGTASARMLDRTGKPIRVPVTVGERPDASGRFRWVTAEVALAPLTMGEYAIEVTLGDGRQVTAFRLIP